MRQLAYALVYVLGRGLRGMGQSPVVQLLAVGTMAVCMLMLGTALLIFDNTRAIAAGWGIDVPVTVYMAEEVPPADTERLRTRLAAIPGVRQVVHVGPDAALARLERGLGGQASLLAGIDAEALPASLEVYVEPTADPGLGASIAARLEQLATVDEVAVLGPWVQQADVLLTTLRELALGVGVLVSLACTAIVWSTIRLGVFARREEIQILRLVGGTPGFVRAPFLIEGMVQGALGSALALVLLYLAFDALRPHLEDGLVLLLAAGSIHFFSPAQVLLGLAFGAGLGAVGSAAAVARHVEG